MGSAMEFFSHRDCPHCGAGARRTLLRIDCDAIFRSNVFYRADALSALSLGGRVDFPIDQCMKCGFIYAGLLPDVAFLAEVYDRVIDSSLARASNLSISNIALKMPALATLLNLLGRAEGAKRVLDFGCGFGPGLELLRACPLVRALGYETSKMRLADLHERGLNATDDLNVVLRAAPFDAVILDNVLEHVPSPRETLRFISRAAAPGAFLFVSVPDCRWKKIVAQQQVTMGSDPIPMDINPWEHLNYFDVKHLDWLLAEQGFGPLTSADIANPVDIGVRPARSRFGRFKNSLASLPRLARYVVRGDVLPSVTGRFYRKVR